MRLSDQFNFAWQVVRGSPGRTFLILLAMGIGVAAVVAVRVISLPFGAPSAAPETGPQATR